MGGEQGSITTTLVLLTAGHLTLHQKHQSISCNINLLTVSTFVRAQQNSFSPNDAFSHENMLSTYLNLLWFQFQNICLNYEWNLNGRLFRSKIMVLVNSFPLNAYHPGCAEENCWLSLASGFNVLILALILPKPALYNCCHFVLLLHILY